MDGLRDGICNFNALGTYLHLHALGEPRWAECVLTKAAEFKSAREASSGFRKVVGENFAQPGLGDFPE
ncbi:MAG: hypothetical protein HY912_14510 [Desulfomonile tiedjei]|uniref:CobB/CobQ-like glutamine amidotransferase domain-containing protein n=1 Tax=Desulfomonile tiedjei TaxID=2358 RepID=A0A9D6V381_9BACT|nr:hypothetical protein [Desulfomonile tiedjei]